jgi:hypothetical protein
VSASEQRRQWWLRFLRQEGERGGNGWRGLDGSRDTLLCARQLAKAPGHAQRVEDTRRRWPETVGHPVLCMSEFFVSELEGVD